MSITITEIEGIEQRVRPWIVAQRIGVAAYGLMAAHELSRKSSVLQNGRPPENLRVFIQELQPILVDSLSEFLGESTNDRHLKVRIGQLPPHVLYILNTVLTSSPKYVPRYVKRLKDVIEEDLRWLDRPRTTTGNALRPALLHKAKIISYHILYSSSSAQRIVALLVNFHRSKRHWKNHPINSEQLYHLDELLTFIRTPLNNSKARLFAINQIGSIIGHLDSWHQVENILISHTFCWPLYIFSDVDQDIGISIPIAIDVTFPDDQGYVERPDQRRTRQGVDKSNWDYHLQNAVRAAKMLWLSKHKHYTKYFQTQLSQDPSYYDFLRKVDESVVDFDFHWADMIFEGISVSLNDGSANSLLAMAVLAKFLGRKAFLSSAITGLISTHYADPEDFQFLRPGGVSAKLRYVFAARTFERAVLPNDKSTWDEVVDVLVNEKIEIRQTAQVIGAGQLSTLADIVQVGGWRQDKYIRCPDIEWIIHGRRDSQLHHILSSDPQVPYVLEKLEDHSNPILDLQKDNIHPRVVATALQYINETYRQSIRPSIRPPKFSSLFIRVAPEQQDNLFWEVLWNGFDATKETFIELCSALNSEEAARILAEALNCFEPSVDTPSFRAPDIIVIVGVEHFTGLEKTIIPTSRSLAANVILDKLGEQDKLQLSPNVQDLYEYLGRVRIILLRDIMDNYLEVEFPLPEVSSLSDFEQNFIKSLSVFRWGFNYSIALFMLRTSALAEQYSSGVSNIRNLLHSLVDNNILRYSMGWYHLPSSLRNSLYGSLSEEDKISYHMIAGKALAPYTHDVSLPSFSLDYAFLSEHIYEALYHFNYVEELTKEMLSNSSHMLHAHLLQNQTLRFTASVSEYPIIKLNSSYRSEVWRDAYLMGIELINSYKTANRDRIHPKHYVNLIRSIHQLLPNYLGSQPDEADRLDKEVSGQDGILVQAMNACDDPYLINERDVNRLLVLSAYARYCHAGGLKYKDRLPEIDKNIWMTIEQNSDLKVGFIPGESLVRLGSEAENDVDAYKYYKYGILYTPKFYPLWILAFGASTLAFENPDEVINALDAYVAQESSELQVSLTRENIFTTIIRSINIHQDHLLDASLWHRRRWNTGISVIQDRGGYSLELLYELQKVTRYT